MFFKNPFQFFLLVVSAARQSSEKELLPTDGADYLYEVVAYGAQMTFDAANELCNENEAEFWDSTNLLQLRAVSEYLTDLDDVNFELSIWTPNLEGHTPPEGEETVTSLNLKDASIKFDSSPVSEPNATICVRPQILPCFGDCDLNHNTQVK